MTTETTSQTEFNILPNILVIAETEPNVRLIKRWTNPLKLVAYQNNLRLNERNGYNKAVRIFKQSILNN